ncbi:MAG: thiol-activated cytolysin family protein [Rikenellaceae bacterium]
MDDDIQIDSFSDIRAAIKSIATYPDQDIQALQTYILSAEEQESELLISYGYNGYYNPIIYEEQKVGFEKCFSAPYAYKYPSSMWPGNIVQGKSIINNECDDIPLNGKRSGGTIYLNVVSGATSQLYRELETVSAANVTQAMNDILSDYDAGFPANVSFQMQTISTKDEMAYAMNVPNSEFENITQGAFNSVDWTNSKSTKQMVLLKQTFFTMSYDPPGGLSDMLLPNVSIDDFSGYMSADNPPCYISSVSYGRYFILLIESEYVKDYILDMTDALVDGLDEYVGSELVQSKSFSRTRSNDINNDYTEVFSSSNIQLVQIGGNPVSGLDTIKGDIESLRDFIISGATFSKDNVGAPIDFTVKYLSNNTTTSRYREIDTTYTRTEYVDANAGVNNVSISIDNIKCNALSVNSSSRYEYISNGNSYLTVNNITVKRISGAGQTYTLGTVNPELNKVSVKSTHQKSFNQEFCTEEALGLYTDDIISVDFSAYYNVYTYNDSAFKWGNSGNISKTYNFGIQYKFNPNTYRWEVYSTTSTSGANYYDFSSIQLRTTLNSCSVVLELGISFYVDGKKY